MEAKSALREIFKEHDQDTIKLYSELLKLEKDNLNNRHENEVIQTILLKIKEDVKWFYSEWEWRTFLGIMENKL